MRTEQLGQDSECTTAGEGKQEEDARAGQLGQECQDLAAFFRIRQPAQDNRAG